MRFEAHTNPTQHVHHNSDIPHSQLCDSYHDSHSDVSHLQLCDSYHDSHSDIEQSTESQSPLQQSLSHTAISELQCILTKIPNFPQTQSQIPNYFFYFPQHLNGHYRYTQDLLTLDSFHPTPTKHSLPDHLCTIVTPLNLSAWAHQLQDMPDKLLVNYLLSGIYSGFRIGYNSQSTKLKSARANMASALINPQPASEFIATERQAGRILGPVHTQQIPSIHISRFGIIPKCSQPGKWHLILDLSFPALYSVNDGIDPELCSMSYTSVDHAAKIIASLGHNTLLAKIDIAHAYRNVPIHPQDRSLLGMQWDGTIYVDSVLPFGLRLAPKIFPSISDSLEWILRLNQVSHVLHYLDDFLTAGAPQSTQCNQNLGRIIKVCESLGLPLATEKIEGPSTSLVFLGILLDSSKMEIRLPDQKLQNLKTTIAEWLEKKVVPREICSPLSATYLTLPKLFRKAVPSFAG